MINSKIVFKLKDTFTFGKYKGDTIEKILTRDAQYIRWCCKNIPWFGITRTAKKRLAVAKVNINWSNWLEDEAYEDAIACGYAPDVDSLEDAFRDTCF